MERFDLREEYEDDWLKQIASGDAYVTPTYQEDDYGDFLTGHVPLYDSRGQYSGFVVSISTCKIISRARRASTPSPSAASPQHCSSRS
jgi:hypothetical protein